MEDTDLRLALRSLAITRRILHFKPIHAFLHLLDSCIDADHQPKRVRHWGAYAAALVPFDGSPEKAVRSFLATDENQIVKAVLAGDAVPEVPAQLEEELKILAAVCAVSSSDLRLYFDTEIHLPVWDATHPDLTGWYRDLLASCRREGFGMFRTYHLFRILHGKVTPVKCADPVSLDELQGYPRQRSLVVTNVKALLRGAPASDMLLYGDSGTGKSSTIKAVANDLYQEGLRLIEVRPSQLHHIPELLEKLSRNPLKFLLFIDDLSFAAEDDNFRALKATLEGSVLCRASNVVICATSNRRRLIRETFSDRNGDDVHANETIQQTAALSDRFGLTIPFTDPKRDVYFEMVESAADRMGIDLPKEELFAGAERFALEKGGRSGRAARQYVDQVKSGVIIPGKK